MFISFSYLDDVYTAEIIYNFDTFPNVFSLIFTELLFENLIEIVLCRNPHTNTWYTDENYEMKYPEFFKKMIVPLENIFKEAEKY